jgi:hypothetical protein
MLILFIESDLTINVYTHSNQQRRLCSSTKTLQNHDVCYRQFYDAYPVTLQQCLNSLDRLNLEVSTTRST